MAKGQMRVPKEKKKPKADKDKPKQVSAYKLAQTGGSSTMSAPGAKKPHQTLRWIAPPDLSHPTENYCKPRSMRLDADVSADLAPAPQAAGRFA